jgi:hypothetical protein
MLDGKLLVTVTYRGVVEVFERENDGTGFNATEPVTHKLPVLVTGKLLGDVT